MRRARGPGPHRHQQRPNAGRSRQRPEFDELTSSTRANASATYAATPGADIRTGTPVTAVEPGSQNAIADDNASTSYGKSRGLVSAQR